MIAGSAVKGERWTVPVELALAATNSAMRDAYFRMRGRGLHAKNLAVVYRNGDWLFAIVDFHGPDRPGLLFRLDVNLEENR